MADEKLTTTLQFQTDITEFKAAMQEANRSIKLANSEFKAATAGMDDWAGSTDGLAAKLRQLSDVHAAEQRKLDVLREAYAKVAKEQGENSAAAQDLRVQINNQQAAVNKAEKDHRNFAEKLEDVEKAAKDAEKELDDAGKAARKAGKEAEESGDGWTIAKDIISDLATEAISSFIDAITSAADETRDYRREMAKMAQNAADAEHDMKDVKKILSEVSASTGDAEAAMEGLNMLMATGLDTRDIEKASKALAGAATRFDGLNFESIAEGLQETLAVGEGVGPFAELIERTGGNLEEFNAGLAACTTQAEKQQYIMDFLAKSGLQDVHDAYVRHNADLVEAEEAQFRANEAMAGMGAAVEPINTHLRNIGSTLLEKITPIVEEVVDFTMENLPIIEPIIAGLAASMGVLAAKMAIAGLVKSLNAAFVLLNTTMKANPILLVVSALAGLAAGISAFVAHEGKKFVNSAKEWADSVTPFNSALKSARANTVDFKNALSSTGNTMGDLETAIGEAENGITAILRTAMDEQRALREDELIKIQEYNQRIRELEAEKMSIYQDQMQAEITMLQHRRTLNQEDAIQTLANQKEYLSQANEAARLAYQNEIIQIQNKHKTAGTLHSEAYAEEIVAAQSHYNKQAAENEKYYSETVALVMKKADEWVKVDAGKWDDLNNKGRKSRTEYSRILSMLDADNANAFLSMYRETVRTGGKIPKETEEIAKDMLESFMWLPADMEESGKSALLGLIGGMEEEIPALKNASEMTAHDIANVLAGELEIYSPSRVTKRMGNYVTEGLAKGMTEKENWLRRETSSFVGRTMSFFQNLLGIHSPSTETQWMGEMMVAGLVNALNAGRKNVQTALSGLTESAFTGNGFNDVNVNANGRNIPGGKQIVFNQYNTSPKALSRREIYRQTHNALATVGGA